MSRPDAGQLVPISDVEPHLFANRKLRLVGTVTALAHSTLLILSDLHPSPSRAPRSVLVDLSLCAVPGIAPALKSTLMVLGTLTHLDHPLDLTFATTPAAAVATEPKLPTSVFPLRTDVPLPNGHFVLEALLVKPLDHTFDIALWNHAARLRSHADWQAYPPQP